jgi:hypothetical protein
MKNFIPITQIVIILFLVSCKTKEKIIVKDDFNYFTNKTINNPNQYISKTISSLVKDFKQDYQSKYYSGGRFLILGSIVFVFDDNFELVVLIDKKNSNFVFAVDPNKDFDFEKLKSEHILDIKIYKKTTLIYTTE